MPGAAARRQAVQDATSQLRAVWSGAVGGAAGFLRPEPLPPIVIGAFGPKMAELAGRAGDGLNTPGGQHAPALVALARQAYERSGRDPAEFLVTMSARPSRRERDNLAELGVDRMILSVGPPYSEGVARLHAALIG